MTGWQSGARMGASPLLGYTVEVYSSHRDPSADSQSWTWAGSSLRIKNSWRIAARRLQNDQIVLANLHPSTSYTFLVITTILNYIILYSIQLYCIIFNYIVFYFIVSYYIQLH